MEKNQSEFIQSVIEFVQSKIEQVKQDKNKSIIVITSDGNKVNIAVVGSGRSVAEGLAEFLGEAKYENLIKTSKLLIELKNEMRNTEA